MTIYSEPSHNLIISDSTLIQARPGKLFFLAAAVKSVWYNELSHLAVVTAHLLCFALFRTKLVSPQLNTSRDISHSKD